MRITKSIILIIALALLAACDSTAGALGGGSENGAGGKVRVGVPF